MSDYKLFEGVLLKDLRQASENAELGETRNVQVILPRAIDAAQEVRRLLHEAISNRTQLEETDFLDLVIRAHNLI
jgi:hypothetical protein